MRVPRLAMFAMKLHSQIPSRSRAAILRLAIGLFLLPLCAIAQQSSSIEVEVSAGSFSPCGSITETGHIVSPLVTPLMPSAGSQVLFRLRKNSIATPSENLRLDRLEFALPSSDIFLQLSPTDVQFGSSPPLPFSHSNGGTQLFNMTMLPPEAGTYRFIFSSALWDGGSCTVDIPVAEELACLIESIDGIGAGSPQQGVLNFGSLPVGQVAVGTIRFNFFNTLPIGEGIRASAFLDPPFEFDGESYSVSPSRDQATLDVIFAPDDAGSFSQTVDFFTDREAERPECRIEVEFVGEGVAPELSLTFGTPVCGDNVEVPVMLRNETAVQVTNLEAIAPEGYSLVADPPGSFNIGNFSLGPLGSNNPPAQRRFVLRLVQGPGSLEPFVTVEQQGELIARAAVPTLGCIQILEPADLTLSFGNVPVNTEAPPQSIRIANRGNNLATVTATVRNGGLAAGFGLGPGAAASVTLGIPPASEQVLDVTFLPPNVGARQAMVDFASTGFAGIPSVSLSGSGVEQARPMLSFVAGGSPINPGGTIVFPTTGIGQTSSVPLVITNQGDLGALNLVLSATNAEFGVSGSSPAELAPGQSANYTLTFGPNQAGTRSGQLRVAGANVDPILLALEGVGSMGQVTVNGVGLSGNVSPGQTPLPTIGLEMAGGAASQALEGDLLLEFTPNLPQAPPGGFAAAYQAVRFLAGTGNGGRTIAFRIEQGQQRAVFPAEQNAQLAQFQSGTVAGSIQFRLANVRTAQGTAVPVTNPIVGTSTVARLAPTIRSLTTPQITGGINVVVQAFSTTREVTGVCLALSPAAGADLTFTRPDPSFLNTLFSQWFNGSASFAHGGSFSLTIPIDISDMRAFGSAQVWLRNGEGWSAPNSPCQ